MGLEAVLSGEDLLEGDPSPFVQDMLATFGRVDLYDAKLVMAFPEIFFRPFAFL